MRKIYPKLATAFFVIFGTLIFAQYALAQCAGVCGGEFDAPAGYIADNSGNSDCATKDPNKPFCFIPGSTNNSGIACPGVCAAATSNCMGADYPDYYSAGDTSCKNANSARPICCANNCKANGGSCIDAGSTCSQYLQQYNSSCGTQVCCKTSGSGGPANSNPGEFTGNGIEIPTGTGLSEKSILEIVTNLLDWLLTIFLILALIAFAVTGIQYLLAMGNSRSNTTENAKNNFRYAIMAVVIVGAGLIILRAIDNFLNANPMI